MRHQNILRNRQEVNAPFIGPRLNVSEANSLSSDRSMFGGELEIIQSTLIPNRGTL